MPKPNLTPAFRNSSSRVDQALLRLQRNREQAAQTDQQTQQQFESWRSRWSSRRRRIAEQLSVIEAEMDRLAGPLPTTPQLAIVGGN